MTDVSGEYERPVIIHRAVMGSIERMMGILTEHTGGKWPFWLSPRQCVVIPVSEKNNEYAREVFKQIEAEGFYVDIDDSNTKQLQKKIRESQIAQYNYILVVGQEEMNNQTVSVRTRDNVVHGSISVKELVQQFQLKCKNFE